MTPNTAEKNLLATDFATRYANASLIIRDSTTVLATHSLSGFGTASSGVVTASSIPAATNAANGTADNAILDDGSAEYTLTVGTTGSGADVEIDDLAYALGGTSSIAAFTVAY